MNGFPYTRTVACSAPLDTARLNAIAPAGVAFHEYASPTCSPPLQGNLFEWEDHSLAVKRLRRATFDASIDALRESRLYLNEEEHAKLAHAVIASFVADSIASYVNEAVNTLLRDAFKPQHG